MFPQERCEHDWDSTDNLRGFKNQEEAEDMVSGRQRVTRTGEYVE